VIQAERNDEPPIGRKLLQAVLRFRDSVVSYDGNTEKKRFVPSAQSMLFNDNAV
jgi:hypothetical protein